MEDGHHLDQVQGEEGVVQHDQRRAKELKEDDQIHLAPVEVQVAVRGGLEVEVSGQNPSGESLEVRVVPCSVRHSERGVGHLEEVVEALQVFQDGVGSSVGAGGQRIHFVAKADEGQSQILLQRAVDQCYEHQVAEPEA